MIVIAKFVCDKNPLLLKNNGSSFCVLDSTSPDRISVYWARRWALPGVKKIGTIFFVVPLFVVSYAQTISYSLILLPFVLSCFDRRIELKFWKHNFELFCVSFVVHFGIRFAPFVRFWFVSTRYWEWEKKKSIRFDLRRFSAFVDETKAQSRMLTRKLTVKNVKEATRNHSGFWWSIKSRCQMPVVIYLTMYNRKSSLTCLQHLSELPISKRKNSPITYYYFNFKSRD